MGKQFGAALDLSTLATNPISPEAGTLRTYARADGRLYTEDTNGVINVLHSEQEREPVRVTTTGANITLSGTQTIDGVALAVGDRVLVAHQTTGTQNGIYVVASGAWTRVADADVVGEVQRGTTVRVMEGDNHKGKTFTQSRIITTYATDMQEWVDVLSVSYGGFVAPSPTRTGQLYWDGTRKTLMGWDGGSWQALGQPWQCTSTTRPAYPNEDLVIYETDTGLSYIYSAGAWKPFGGSGRAGTGIPAGTIHIHAGGTVPSGWLLCDGSAISRATYPDLFAAIGTTYGAGDGSTTFGLPNLTARFPRGAASGAASATGGAATHTHPLSDAGQAQISVAATTTGIHARRVNGAGWTEALSVTATGGGSSAAQTTGTPLMGSTDAGSSLPPYIDVYFIIATVSMSGSAVQANLALYNAAAMSIPTGVWTRLTAGANDSEYPPTQAGMTSNGGYIGVTVTGMYLVTATVVWPTSVANTRRGVQVDRTAGLADALSTTTGIQQLTTPGSATGITTAVSGLIYAKAGEFLRCWAYQDSGSTVTLPIHPLTKFNAMLLGNGSAYNLSVQDENTTVVPTATTLDFQGAGVSTAQGVAGEAIVTIPGGLPDGPNQLIYDHASQNSGATTGWQRQTGGSITCPTAGLYLVYIYESFGTGTAGTNARRGIAIGDASAIYGECQHIEICGNNASQGMSTTFMRTMNAGDAICPYRYTDVANHYSAGGGYLRAVRLG